MRSNAYCNCTAVIRMKPLNAESFNASLLVQQADYPSHRSSKHREVHTELALASSREHVCLQAPSAFPSVPSRQLHLVPPATSREPVSFAHVLVPCVATDGIVRCRALDLITQGSTSPSNQCASQVYSLYSLRSVSVITMPLSPPKRLTPS